MSCFSLQLLLSSFIFRIQKWCICSCLVQPHLITADDGPVSLFLSLTLFSHWGWVTVKRPNVVIGEWGGGTRSYVWGCVCLLIYEWCCLFSLPSSNIGSQFAFPGREKFMQTSRSIRKQGCHLCVYLNLFCHIAEKHFWVVYFNKKCSKYTVAILVSFRIFIFYTEKKTVR